MIHRHRTHPVGKQACVLSAALMGWVLGTLCWGSTPTATSAAASFHLQEATIAQIQREILAKHLTTEQVVRLYLNRIKAYNGTCVKEPQGLLGPIQTIAHAGQVNALQTLNLRPVTRAAWGFDARKARSMTDSVDDNPSMPD